MSNDYLSSGSKEVRYKALLDAIWKLPDFSDIWASTDNVSIPQPLYFTTVSTQFGNIKCLHSKVILIRPYAEQTKVAFYVPFGPENESVLRQIREKVPNMAFEFLIDQRDVSRIL